MRFFLRPIAVVLVLSIFCLAQQQIATVASDSPFQLRGANVTPGQGVPYWPVLPGDKVTAGDTPATVTFPDGSTIVLAPHSSAQLSLSGKTPVFVLQSGTAHYMLQSVTAVKLFEVKKGVTPASLAGDLQVGPNRTTGTWWTAGHTALVVGGAGAATGISLAVVNSKPVSPICNNGNGKGNGNGNCK